VAEPSAGIPDVVGPGLVVLFCGINPGLVSAATGRHFARPGNRFWKVLAASGFTDHQLDPSQQSDLVDAGIGITNLVERPSAGAADLAPVELRDGAARLEAKVARLAPRFVAILGVQAYRGAWRRPKASIGRQPEGLGRAGLWVLPNPSGLQAHYQLPEMTLMFAELRAAAFGPA
jgi:double-stranded uracil-DNA glycosylase